MRQVYNTILGEAVNNAIAGDIAETAVDKAIDKLHDLGYIDQERIWNGCLDMLDDLEKDVDKYLENYYKAYNQESA